MLSVKLETAPRPEGEREDFFWPVSIFILKQGRWRNKNIG